MKAGRRPRYDSSPVGVRAALEALRRHVLEGRSLVTLVGGPGIGKTRLAAELTTQLESAGAVDAAAGAFECFWCDVGQARTPGDLMAQLYETLRLEPPSAAESGAMLEPLAGRLEQSTRALLVLDAFEHLPHEAQALLAHLSERAPYCTMLVTSRAHLKLPTECVFEVEPLALPLGAEDPAQSPAYRLFVERAFGPRGAPASSAADRDAIADIVRRLDGNPLAIELAAGRSGVLSPAGILARLDDPWKLLRRAPVNGGSRHDSLRDAFESSWVLLDEVERRVLVQLAVFEGGFTLDGAEHVVEPCAAGSIGPTPAIVDVVQSLRDQSLLRRHREGLLGSATLLEVPPLIRDFARSRRADPDLERAARARHACWTFTRTVDPSADNVFDSSERANLHAALVFALEEGEPVLRDRALRALIAAGVEFLRKLPGNQHRALVESAMAVAPPDAAEVRGWLHLLHGTFGFDEESRREMEAARDMAVKRALPLLEAHALYCLGRLDVLARPQLAIERLRRAQTLLEQAGEAYDVARACFQMARAHQALGCSDDSVRLYRRALALFQDSGRRGSSFVALVQINLGRHLWGTGRLDEAIDTLRPTAAAESHGDGDDEPIIAGAYLAGVLAETGRAEEAQVAAERALRLARRAGLADATFDLLQPLAAAYLALGRADIVVELCAVRSGSFEQHPLYAPVLLGLTAAAEALRDNLEGARTALAAARRRLAGKPAPRTEAVLELVERQLDVAHCRHALLLGELNEARRHHRAARAEGAGGEAAEPIVRLLRSVLDRQIPLVEERLSRLEGTPQAPLVLDRSQQRFRPPGGEEHCLRTRRAQWALLETLAQARLERPGVPVRDTDLCVRTWGDGSAPEDAVANRLRVSLTALRKQGLDGLIVRKAGGYMLKPELTVLLVG